MKNLAIIILVIIFASCKSIQRSDFRNQHKLNNKIPNLAPKIDNASLGYSYTQSKTESEGDFASTPLDLGDFGNYTVGGFESESTTTLDKRKKDILTLFTKDVEDNICKSGENKGTIELKIEFEDEYHKKEYFYAYILLAGIPSLFGAPNFYVEQQLELTIYIKDKGGNVIKKYSQNGKGQAPIALYWGYSDDIYTRTMSSGNRKANIEAYKDVMKKIKSEINKDSKMITDKLNNQ